MNEFDELKDAVDRINGLFFEKIVGVLPDELLPDLTMCFNDWYYSVKLTIYYSEYASPINIEVYNSENNDRKSDYTTEEPLYDLIVRNIESALVGLVDIGNKFRKCKVFV